MTHIDLLFGLTGTSCPISHEVALFGAISRRIGPETHLPNGVAICAIPGTPVGGGLLQLDERSRLRLRMPADEIPRYLALAGKLLDIGGHHVRVGVPTVQALRPAATLRARLVTIKGFREPQPFLEAVRRKLSGHATEPPMCELGLSEYVRAAIPLRQHGPHAGEPVRRVLRIKDKTVVGFEVLVSGLTAEESIILQERGIGGRRHMGCGVFLPFRERA